MIWYEWFGFKSDPFLTVPLQSEDEFNSIFVKTGSLEQDVSYILSQMGSNAFSQLAVGARGVGKSTTLQYTVYICRKKGYLSSYIGLLPYGIKYSREPLTELSYVFLQSIIREILISIYTFKKDIFNKYKTNFIRTGNLIGMVYDESEGFIGEYGQRLEYKMLGDVFYGILDLVKRNSLKMFFALDNLDKIESKTLVEFLKGYSAQPFFEALNSSGISVLMAVDPDTAKIIEKDPNLNYLKSKMTLNNLSPPESEDLIKRRIECFSNKKTNSIIEIKAIHHISNSKNGITRDILNELKDVFISSYSKGKTFISYDFIINQKDELNEREIYYDMIKDYNNKNASDKLLTLSSNLKEEEVSEVISYLISFHNNIPVKLTPNITNYFVKNEIITYDKPNLYNYKLSYDINSLFNNSIENRWTIEKFLHWLFKKEKVDVVKIQYIGDKALYSINDFNDKIFNLKIPNKKIKLIINEKDVYFSSIKWREEILLNFKNISRNYTQLKNIDLSDIDTVNVQSLLHFILKDYLINFSKYYLFFQDDALKFNTDKNYLENWSFIFRSIESFEHTNSIKFSTIFFVREILDNYRATKYNNYIPPYYKIEDMITNLEHIILEFNKSLDVFENNNSFFRKLHQNKNTQEAVSNLYYKLIRYSIGEKYEQEIEITNIIDELNLEKIDYNKDVVNNMLFIRSKKLIINNEVKMELYIPFVIGINHEVTHKDIPKIMVNIEYVVNSITKLYKNAKINYVIWVITYKGFTYDAVKMMQLIKKSVNINISMFNLNKLNSIFLNNNIELLSRNAKQVLAKKHVFIAYRFGNNASQQIAIKLSNFLKEKQIPIWYFEEKVNWSDIITKEEEKAIDNSFGAIICFTSDFMDGKTASQEYYALINKKRYDDDYKLGLVLIDCEHENVPAFARDLFNVSISDHNDPDFEKIALQFIMD